ncbi:CMRF35-like molecule 5 isoform X3 [Dicentrarchus labrax]|uniref:CMRF35-like molecule 5 isoform X2 n=1 Tax=Dicentrarchus labrax TaxID=13489 RepID=UPI0021F66CD4|nr:CMRF35-like molecule 5 isoform X2 [Dicentrarchus labrax]XP_051282592.1 CMRF35-like molecule 5 isoform X3 [Dicentrarchus labrax]
MITIYVYSCLLSALSVVVVKPLNIDGRVGTSVTFKCSDWNGWTNVKYHVKYLCADPCSRAIIKAAFKETVRKNRIELTNSAEGLFVTFIHLQKSDSKKYYCAVERTGPDSYIEVNLKVIDAESSTPKTTPKSFAVTKSSTVSSSSSDSITDLSASYTTLYTTPTASATQGLGSVPYLILGVTVILTILLVLLKLMRKTTKKQLKGVPSAERPQEDTPEEVEYDEIRPEDCEPVSQPAGVSTLYFSADPGSLYTNYSHHQYVTYSKDASSSGVSSGGASTESTYHQCDLMYSVVQRPKKQTEATDQSEPHQSESIENDSLYSLAQLPQTT